MPSVKSPLRWVWRITVARFPALYWFRRGLSYYRAREESLCEKLIHEEIAARIAACQPARVLEYGVGNAAFLKKLSTLLPATEFHAVDISATQIKTARANFSRGVYSVADLSAIDYPDEHFDVVVGLGVLIYLPSRARKAAFGELYRVTRHRLFAVEYITRFFDAEMKARFDAAGDFRYDYDLETSFRDAGFAIAECSRIACSWNRETNPTGDLPHGIIVANRLET